jgi:glycosyltransferase involved in cell wall biosynthesis
MVTLIRSDLSSRTRTSSRRPWSAFLSKRIDHIGILSSDRIITNNVATQEEITAVVGSRKKEEVKLLFNDIPSIPRASEEAVFQVRTRFGIPKEGKLVVTAGVLTRGKNFEVLLKCLPHIGMSNLFLAIIGDAWTKADVRYVYDLRRLTRTLDIEKRVIFTGWVGKEDVGRMYGAADLFILPSLKEGMPNVMLEALGVNIPCIGSNIPGIRDILHFEELMFDPADEKAISRIVFQFFSDVQFPARIRRLCQERKQVFLFDWKEKVFEMVSGLPVPPGGERIRQGFHS